ncbi:arabinan endo-1,5-alpha-L-arabinosidase [Chitinophaga flava]|uniref:Arabinan endo-1,5-alpha-L-arabinosidase n=2 Tax=Chitinophaga flava TaxID=2259036 RepID=A0A365XPU4_9BACT|nr:arabinan endo-1,5-alpha-L-arabinosidase [Chitinophaga flava]
MATAHLADSLQPEQAEIILEENVVAYIVEKPEPPARIVQQPLRVGNPVFPGWYADPEGVVFGKTYWIFPTFSAPYNQQVYFDAFSSTDLITWKKHPRILDTAVVKWARRAMWAPAVIQKGKQYFFFFGANDIQRNGEPGGIGIAVADKPEGPYRDYLGKPLIDSFYNKAQPIDQYVFQDRDGAFYLIYGGWGHCNIARLKDDFTGFVPFSDGTVFREITPEKYVEGPTMFMRNGKYYFMWSEGGWTGPDYSVAYAIADTPTGPFRRIGKILQQDPAIATGAGHHSIIHAASQNKWFIVYHRRPLGLKDANARETCIDEMFFNEDGTIKSVIMTKEGVKQLKL